MIPVIETERLILRGHELSDFENSARMWADPVVVKYITGVPSSRQASWSRFLNYRGMWDAIRMGYWLVEEKSSRKFVGEVGLADFKRELKVDVSHLPEAGWILRPEFHGKGYAKEAVSGMLQWGDKAFRKDNFCIISPENEASIRIAHKSGFVFLTESPYMDRPVNVYLRKLP